MVFESQIGVTRLNGRPESVGANKSPESGKLSKDLPGKSSKRSERNRILFPPYPKERETKETMNFDVFMSKLRKTIKIFFRESERQRADTWPMEGLAFHTLQHEWTPL